MFIVILIGMALSMAIGIGIGMDIEEYSVETEKEEPLSQENKIDNFLISLEMNPKNIKYIPVIGIFIICYDAYVLGEVNCGEKYFNEEDYGINLIFSLAIQAVGIAGFFAVLTYYFPPS